MVGAGYDASGVSYPAFDSRLNPHGHPSHFQPAPTAHYVNGSQVQVEDPAWAHSIYSGAIAAKGQYTPPVSAHGPMAAYGLARAQQQHMMNGHLYSSPIDGDDGSSGVGSAPGTGHGVPIGRARSGSNAPMPIGSYDEYSMGGHGAPVAIPHGRSRGLSVSTGVGSVPNVGSWDSVGSQMGMSPHGPMGQMKASPIAIPGAVNMSAGAAMAMMF